MPRVRTYKGKASLRGRSRLHSRVLSQEFIEELELLDATEVIQVVRRPDETMDIDIGEIDVDTAIALLAKAFVKLVVDEVLEIAFEYEEEVEGDGDDE